MSYLYNNNSELLKDATFTGKTQAYNLSVNTNINCTSFNYKNVIGTNIREKQPAWYIYRSEADLSGNTPPGMIYGAGSTNVGGYLDTVSISGAVSPNCWDKSTGIFTAPVSGTYYIQMNMFRKNPLVTGRTLIIGGTGVNSGLAGQGVEQTCTFNQASTTSDEMSYEWNTMMYIQSGQTIYFKNASANTVSLYYGVGYTSVTIRYLDNLCGKTADSSLLFYYKFNAEDISNNMIANYATGYPVYDATLMNSASIDTTNQKVGTGCLYLNGSLSQYVQLPDFTSSQNGITLACWFNCANNVGSLARIFDFGNADASNNIGYCPIFGSFVYQGSVAITQGYGGGYADSNWKYLVWTLSCTNTSTNTGTWNVYINNVLVSTNSNVAYPLPVSRVLNYIGKSNWAANPYLTGYIDEFRYYNRVLSATEISNLYNLINPNMNLVKNGNFLNPLYNSSSGAYAYSRNIPNWTTTNDNVGTSVTNSPWNGNMMPKGFTQFLFMQRNNTTTPQSISQLIPLKSGYYNVSFYYQKRLYRLFDPSHSLTVSIGSNTLVSNLEAPSNWTLYTYPFYISTDSSYNLTFTSTTQNVTDSSILITGVSISAISSANIILLRTGQDALNNASLTGNTTMKNLGVTTTTSCNTINCQQMTVNTALTDTNQTPTWFITGGSSNGVTPSNSILGAGINVSSPSTTVDYFKFVSTIGGASQKSWDVMSGIFTAPFSGIYYIQLNIFHGGNNGRFLQIGGTGVNSGLANEGVGQYCLTNSSGPTQWTTMMYIDSGKTIYFKNASSSAMWCYFYAAHTNLTIISIKKCENDKLLFYYKFNNGDINNNMLANYATGYPVYDASVNNSAIIDISNQALGTGCLYLNASLYQSVKLPPLTIDTNGMTISCWYKCPSTIGSWIRLFEFGIENNGNTNNFLYAPNYGVGIYQGTTVNLSAAANNSCWDLTTWNLCVWTMSCTGKDGSNNNIGTNNVYINNSLIYTNTTALYPQIMTRTGNWLGRSNNTADGYYSGYIDEFRYYGRVLSQDEISNLYTNNIPT